jgi:hypothetical protein
MSQTQDGNVRATSLRSIQQQSSDKISAQTNWREFPWVIAKKKRKHKGSGISLKNSLKKTSKSGIEESEISDYDDQERID